MSDLTIVDVREMVEKAIPGPWHDLIDDNGWLAVLDGDGREVCGLGDMEGIDPDDAWSGKLIAAAPDLARLALALAERLEKAEEELRQLYGPVRAARRHVDGSALLFSQRDPETVARNLLAAERRIEHFLPGFVPEHQ